MCCARPEVLISHKRKNKGSISGPHAKERASTDPYHTWKLQDTVSIGEMLFCSESEGGGSAESNDVLLQVGVDIEESKGNELIKAGETNVSVEFEIMHGSRIKEILKPFGEEKGDEVFTTVQYWKNGKGLKLTLADPSGRRERVMESVELYCKKEGMQFEGQESSGGDSVIGNVNLRKVYGKKLVGDSWQKSDEVEGLVGELSGSRVSVVRCKSDEDGKNANLIVNH